MAASRAASIAPPNMVILGGTIKRQPKAEYGPYSGAPVSLLDLEHPCSVQDFGEGEAPWVQSSIEVPERLVLTYPGGLHAGVEVIVFGQQAGGGDIRAEAIFEAEFLRQDEPPAGRSPAQ